MFLCWRRIFLRFWANEAKAGAAWARVRVKQCIDSRLSFEINSASWNGMSIRCEGDEPVGQIPMLERSIWRARGGGTCGLDSGGLDSGAQSLLK